MNKHKMASFLEVHQLSTLTVTLVHLSHF